MVGGAAPIDKGALACGKGNHCAGPRVARVRLSAHTVWRRSSFRPLRTLPMNRMHPPPPHRPPTHHSFPSRRRSSQKRWRSSQKRRRSSRRGRTFPAGMCLGRGRPAALCRCPVVEGWRPRPAPVWWRVEAVVEGGCCRHTGGTGTVAGIADTVDTDAFAGSTPNKTWREQNSWFLLLHSSPT